MSVIPKHWDPLDVQQVVFRAHEKQVYEKDAKEVEVPMTKYSRDAKMNNDCTTSSLTNSIQVVLQWNDKVEDLDLQTSSETCMQEVRLLEQEYADEWNADAYERKLQGGSEASGMEAVKIEPYDDPSEYTDDKVDDKGRPNNKETTTSRMLPLWPWSTPHLPDWQSNPDKPYIP